MPNTASVCAAPGGRSSVHDTHLDAVRVVHRCLPDQARFFVSFDVSSIPTSAHGCPCAFLGQLSLVNTVILLVSSVTIDLDVAQSPRGRPRASQIHPGVSLGDESSIPWLGLTTALASASGRSLFAWRQLSASGFHLLGRYSSSFIII